ncbi:MAG: methyltransferase domain-containing protein [Chloroflexota bacterium]
MEDWHNSEFARKWDSDTVSYNPTRLAQLDILLTILADEYREGTTILDVGMGSGRVEEMLFERIPNATLVGTDFSEPMLELAGKRLQSYRGRYETVRQDLTRASEAILPQREYAIAFSVQVIHNVPHPHKKETFAFIKRALAPGGLFLLLDRIRISTPGLFPAYSSMWRRLDRASGNNSTVHRREGDTFEAHERSVSTRGDQPATLEEHLQWLREAGFAEAACLDLHGNRALFAARKRGREW